MFDEIQKFASKVVETTYQDESHNFGIVEIFRVSKFPLCCRIAFKKIKTSTKNSISNFEQNHYLLLKSIFKGSIGRTGMENFIVKGRISNAELSVKTLTEGLFLVVLKKNWSGCQNWSYVKGVLTCFGERSFHWKVHFAAVYLVKTVSNGDSSELRQLWKKISEWFWRKIAVNFGSEKYLSNFLSKIDPCFRCQVFREVHR